MGFFHQIGDFFSSIVMYGIGFIVVMLFLAMRKQGSWSVSGPALVLKKFAIKKTAVEQEPLIDIVGRPGGLISWLLTLIGLEAESSLKVNATDISSKDTSLFGQQHSVVPISSISSVHCGYRKPVGYFFMSAASFLLGFGGWVSGTGFGSFIGGLFFAGIFFVFYFLRKTIVIQIITRAGTPLGLSFQRSIIENVAVDIKQAQLAAGIINTLVIKSQNVMKVGTAEVMEDALKQVNAIKLSSPQICAYCGKPLEDGARFCTACGHGV